MFRNYFIIMIRTILRKRLFTFINILGLTVGMISSLLIAQYVIFERSYDQFHSNAENIFRLRVQGQKYSGEYQFRSARNFSAAGPEVYHNLPEVTNYTRLRADDGLVKYVDVNTNQVKAFIEEKIFYADTAFLEIFDFPLLYGDAQTAFEKPRSILISRSMAKKYFGDQWESKIQIGKSTLEFSYRSFILTGVFEDVPLNSHLKFDFLISYQTLLEGNDYYHTNWAENSIFTYITLAPGTDIAALEEKFPELIDRHKGEYFEAAQYREDFVLQKLTDVYLHSNFHDEAEVNGNNQSVFYLTIIAAFILVLAWVNYINLSTSWAIERAKEVGVRKVNGAVKGQLIIQFLLESSFINLISIILSLTLMQVLLPGFNQLVGKEMTFILFSQPSIILGAILIFTLGILAAGIYPSIVLASYQPIVVLRGKFSGSGKGARLRKALVISQFAISVALIASTLTIYKQLNYMQQEDLGVQIDQTLVLDVEYMANADIDLSTVKTLFLRISQIPEVTNISSSHFVPGDQVWGWGGYIRQANTPRDQAGSYHRYYVDHNYFENYGIKLKAGRFFSREFASDSTKVILTENARKKLGFASAEKAVGSSIYYPLNGQENQETAEIIGVTEDFHQKSLKNDYQPLIFELLRMPGRYVSMKVSSNDMTSSVSKVESAFNDIFPNEPFNYFFADDFYNEAYKTDVRFGYIFGSFSVLAIIIACLGLFGLTSYTIFRRSPEVGIRKALGASVSSILILLSVDFFKAVLISCLISLPIIHLVLDKWLDNYPFQLQIGLWFYAAPVGIILLITFVTVIFQTLNAAYINPAVSLKDE